MDGANRESRRIENYSLFKGEKAREKESAKRERRRGVSTIRKMRRLNERRRRGGKKGGCRKIGKKETRALQKILRRKGSRTRSFRRKQGKEGRDSVEKKSRCFGPGGWGRENQRRYDGSRKKEPRMP